METPEETRNRLRADIIVGVTDDVKYPRIHNGWDFSQDAKHLVFGDGKGLDVYLCLDEPFENCEGQTCISASWIWRSEDDDVVKDGFKEDAMTDFCLETGVAIEADDGEGNIRDGAWDELIEEAKKTFREEFPKA